LFLTGTNFLAKTASSPIESTSFDGQYSKSYNSHTCFTKEAGLSFDQSFTLDPIEYTVQVWIKTDILPWDTKDDDYTIFSFIEAKSNALICELNSNGQLRCSTDTKKLTINELDARDNFIRSRWYKITLKSSSEEGRTELSYGDFT
jgi:hypothetical protein